jgi:wyosine [tRNA(Phe)-imidazoG37] synthetase (radical SAM superfamily)
MNFTDHRRNLHSNKYIYAVVSRRSKGLSIGINLNIDKICNFDCPYCQVDRSIKGGERNVDVHILLEELQHLFELITSGNLWQLSPFNTAKEEFRRVNDIAFAGDGEPTTCPQFEEVVVGVGTLIQKYGFDVRYHLLSNATLFHTKRIQKALDIFCHEYQGEIWAKLDAGSASWFHRVDGTKFPFQRILDNVDLAAKRYKGQTVLQCMFHKFNEMGPSVQEISLWADRIVHILDGGGDIRLVQVYTVARKPSDKTVLPLQKDSLEKIGAHLTSKIPKNAKTVVEVYA